MQKQFYEHQTLLITFVQKFHACWGKVMEEHLPNIYHLFLGLIEFNDEYQPLASSHFVYNRMLFKTPENMALWNRYKEMSKHIPLILRAYHMTGNDPGRKKRLRELLYCLSLPLRDVSVEQLDRFARALDGFAGRFIPPPLYQESICFEKVLKECLETPIANHSIQRTFKLYLESYCGSNIRAPESVKLSPVHNEEQPQEIPHVLQREIAHLDRKFKVSVDILTPSYAKTILLKCCLDDERLPCVPPISVDIPEGYPFVSPNCLLEGHDYSATPFLLAVQNVFASKIINLPKCYSLSRLLAVWEMSVRQMCSPNAVPVNDFEAIFGI